MCLLLVSLFLGKRRGMRLSKYQQIMNELEHLPSYIETVLDQSDHIRSIAMDLMKYKDFFFLGRGYQYPIAAESSLKFKEITYLHSEAYAAGELKHGSLALISDQVPTIFNLPHDEMFEQNLSNLQEVKARNGKVCVIGDRRVEDADWQITIPETIDEIYPFLTAVAGQLLAYHVADLL
jgi:glutamine---fructose-6-phosphate transaminase (isomerizing)